MSLVWQLAIDEQGCNTQIPNQLCLNFTVGFWDDDQNLISQIGSSFLALCKVSPNYPMLLATRVCYFFICVKAFLSTLQASKNGLV